MIAALVALAALAVEPPKLLPGDPAPPLGVSHWYVGDPVTPGATGRATLVEFTATWCGPCQAVMPELVELAHERADQLDVVAVHVWEMDASSVQGHVDRHPADELPPHVGITSDGPDSARVQWMEAAGRSGIPTLFLVDGTGTIAWIGYADHVDATVARVLSGDWDMAAAREDYVQVMRREAIHDAWSTQLVGEGGFYLPPRQILEVLDEAEAADPDARLAMADLRFPALLVVDRKAAAAFALEAAADPDRVDGSTLNQIAWEVVRDGSKLKVDPKVARTLSQASNDRMLWADPYSLDTWAHVLWREGDHEGAIAAERKVLTLAATDDMTKWATDEIARFESGGKRR